MMQELITANENYFSYIYWSGMISDMWDSLLYILMIEKHYDPSQNSFKLAS